MVHLWMRYAGLFLALVWACGWVFFETVEGTGASEFGQAIFSLVVMLGAVLIAWRWTLIGGALLVLEGLGAIWLFAPVWIWRYSILPFVLMAGPPLVAGVLLLVSAGLISTRSAHAA